MINEKNNINEIFHFILNERKSFFIFAVIIIIVLLISIFFYNSLIKEERIFFQNRIIANFNTKVDSTASFISKSILSLKLDIQSNQPFYSLILNQIEQNYFINFAIVIPRQNDFIEITQKEIDEEITQDAYLGYLSALQAYENKKYALAESYLLENIQTQGNFIYTTLESYKLLLNIYQETDNQSQLSIYANKALSYLLINNIKTSFIIDIIEVLYNINQNVNMRKSLIIQANLFSKILNLEIPENYNINNKNEIKSKFILDYITSQSFLKEYLTLKSTVNNTGIHFFSLLDQNNSIYISFVNINSKIVSIVYSFDLIYLTQLMLDNLKSYEFKFSLNVDEFSKENESYTLFRVVDIAIGTYRKLYMALYVRNNELLSYLSQKRYRITNIAFAILVLMIFITILILLSFTLKEFSLNKLKSDFISIISHELKTPITAMQLMLETIIDRYQSLNDNKKIEYLTNIFKETERLLFLINNLLIYSRSEKNRQSIIISNVELKKVLNDVIEFFKIDKKFMKIYIDFPENDIIIEADAHSLKQVFYNLIDNAYKYSKDEKILEIIVTDEKNNVKLRFKDNGIGINSKELPYIFEKFYRGSETNFIPGTGLGLSLTKSIVDMHQGKITVSSQEGVGTEFTIILPKKQKNYKRRLLNESKENLVG